MPTPDQREELYAAGLLAGANTSRSWPTPQDALREEIAALRRDIADLRAALVPVPSLILTGQQVLAEFQRLHQSPQGGHAP
jgi:hypothetical protein